MTGLAPLSPRRSNVLLASLLTISGRLKSTGMAAYARLGLGYLEARIIFVLSSEPGITSAKLAMRIGVDPAAVCRAVRALRERSLISADRRLRLKLTASGEDFGGEIARLVDARFHRLTSAFSAREIDQLTDYLERLQRNLPGLSDPWDPPPDPLTEPTPPARISSTPADRRGEAV